MLRVDPRLSIATLDKYGGDGATDMLCLFIIANGQCCIIKC